MLDQQLSLQLSEYSDLYDKIVPKNHLLRQINDLIDFSFVYKELESKYTLNNGRRAENPIRMFKLTFSVPSWGNLGFSVFNMAHF